MVKAISTFSGCGGSSIGLKQAGIEVPVAVEFVKAAYECYRLNHDATVLTDDIRKVEIDNLLELADVDRGELDILEGSPPCSPFSQSGSGSKGWGKVKKYSDTVQRSDDLFDEALRLTEGLLPKAVLFENVASLASGNSRFYLKQIVSTLKDLGYKVNASSVCASYFGVPQSRGRLYIVGLRDRGSFKLPDRVGPLDPLGKALKVLEGETRLVPSKGKAVDEGDEYAQPALRPYAISREAEKLKPGESSDKYFNLIRPDNRKISPALTATAGNIGAASVIHPLGDRKLSVMEAKIVMGFPLDYKLEGNYQQKIERLGRSVCPPVYKHVGRVLKELLDE